MRGNYSGARSTGAVGGARIQERRARREFSLMYTLNMCLPSSSLTLDCRQSLGAIVATYIC